jgi:ribosomal protein S11
MDVSELRKRILRAVDDARKDATARRSLVDQAVKAYGEYLNTVVVPMLKQTATIVNASGGTFVVSTPADSARLSAQQATETYLEIALDRSGPEPEVVGRVSLARGRQGTIVDERPVATGKPVEKLTEDDLAAYLITAIPKLIVKM